MARLAETASMNVRHTQQLRVAALLDEIAARRHRLYVLKAYGARPAGLRTLKAELTAVRDELAEVTTAAATPRTGPRNLSNGEPTRQVAPARRASVARLSRQSVRPA